MTLGGSASAGDGNENAAEENCRTPHTRTPSPHPGRSATEPLRLDPLDLRSKQIYCSIGSVFAHGALLPSRHAQPLATSKPARDVRGARAQRDRHDVRRYVSPPAPASAAPLRLRLLAGTRRRPLHKKHKAEHDPREVAHHGRLTPPFWPPFFLPQAARRPSRRWSRRSTASPSATRTTPPVRRASAQPRASAPAAMLTRHPRAGIVKVELDNADELMPKVVEVCLPPAPLPFSSGRVCVSRL